MLLQLLAPAEEFENVPVGAQVQIQPSPPFPILTTNSEHGCRDGAVSILLLDRREALRVSIVLEEARYDLGLKSQASDGFGLGEGSGRVIYAHFQESDSVSYQQ
jgi:hypothetical protein